MDQCPRSKSSKISDIVRLQQLLKKWKKLANTSKIANNNNATSSSGATISSSSSTSHNLGRSKSIKFIKRTLSFTDVSSATSNNNSTDFVPKGYLAVCVGEELKRYIIPTEYLGHQAFGMLLREAEEEFGFQQEGVLRIPCEVSLFEKILKVVEQKKRVASLHDMGVDLEINNNNSNNIVGCYSPESYELNTTPHHPQTCR